MQTDYFSGNQIASEDNTGYNIVPYGYFTYRHMSDDEIFYFNINNIVENGIVSTLYPVFTTNIKLDSKYLQYQLNYGYEFAKFARLQKQGGSRTYMYLNKLKKLRITIPLSIKEQKSISKVLLELDRIITLHQRKYFNAMNIKKIALLKFFSTLSHEIYRQFTNSWEQRKFKDIAGTRRGLTYKPTDITDRGIRVLRSSNINEDCFEIHDDDVLVNEDVVNIPYAKNGDILITSANGSSKLIGKHAIIHDIQEKSTVPGGFMLIASSDEPEFINASMSSPWYTKFINVFVSGGNGSIGNLSKVDLDEQYILVPCKEEREKIGSYFSNLDNLITLHQRKCDALKKVKKSLLQKMFPKEGSVVPEIRFAGFTEAWEQRKFLHCISKITDFRGRTPKKLGMEWSESGYLALSALNVKDGYIDFTQDVHYGNQALYDKWMLGNELHQGQVIFTTEAPMGNVAQIPDKRKYILSQRTIAFNVNPNLITENFLATILRTPSVSTTLNALSSGGTAKGVSQKSLAVVKITMPSDLKEQEHLASIFRRLDFLITLHQRKLDQLKTIKKSLLQQMFV